MSKTKCSSCEKFKSKLNFYKNGFNRDGTQRRLGTCIPCYKVYRKENRKRYESKPKSRYRKYKDSAKRRNHEFHLTFTEFKTFENKPCRYCGEKVNVISLDRIDNDIGYIYENVDSCCYYCNAFKHVFDEVTFLKHISSIYEFQKNKIG